MKNYNSMDKLKTVTKEMAHKFIDLCYEMERGLVRKPVSHRDLNNNLTNICEDKGLKFLLALPSFDGFAMQGKCQGKEYLLKVAVSLSAVCEIEEATEN